MNNEIVQENLLLTIFKQAINDFIHNFIFIAFSFSGILLLFGMENSINYRKSNRGNSFTDVFIDFTTDFWKKIFCSFIYLMLIWINIFYLFTIMNTPKLLSIFIIPIIFVTFFIWTLLLYSIIYSAYVHDYNVLRSLKINLKLLIIKPVNMLNIIVIIIMAMVFLVVPIAYLFITIYFIQLIIKCYEKNLELVNKIKREYI